MPVFEVVGGFESLSPVQMRPDIEVIGEKNEGNVYKSKRKYNRI